MRVEDQQVLDAGHADVPVGHPPGQAAAVGVGLDLDAGVAAGQVAEAVEPSSVEFSNSTLATPPAVWLPTDSPCDP